MDRVSYANAVGSVMYTMVCCRLDIAHAMSSVSRYMANPRKEYWKALKWILRYLQGIRDYGLVFGGQSGGFKENSKESYRGLSPLEGFVNANYVDNLDTRRSTIGYLFCIFGGSVSWRSTLQPITSLSTMEAEYIDVTEGAKKILWLRRLAAKMVVEQSKVILYR
ncbi:secreted RxLR effector protein 161-like [Elaeis guineensis]|uniref:secreted RxLR effector protein 161-like n=1 Tax=Elaeis guineensis var. tenera TaxID=51953 RepID=UPI003C6D73DF